MSEAFIHVVVLFINNNYCWSMFYLLLACLHLRARPQNGGKVFFGRIFHPWCMFECTVRVVISIIFVKTNICQKYVVKTNICQIYVVKTNICQIYGVKTNICQIYVVKTNICQTFETRRKRIVIDNQILLMWYLTYRLFKKRIMSYKNQFP